MEGRAEERKTEAMELDWSDAAGASTWNKLFDRYYRRSEIYTMQWENVDLAKMVVAGSNFSGPIALVRDDRKITVIGKGDLRPTLNIYTSAGAQLASIPWRAGRLVEMGWTADEQLVCVLDDGTVNMYNVQGRLIQTFSMGEEFRQDKVLLCCIWGNGLVCLSRRYLLVYVDNWEDPVARKMPRLVDVTSNPTCMAIIEPQFTRSKALEVLLAVDKTILVVDMTGVEDQKLTAGPLRKMSVCPNGKMLACFTHDGFVWVITTDFSKNLSEFPTKSQVPPNQLVWCGTDSVVLYWDKIVLMVGPYGDWVKYSYEQSLSLIAELDGVRIISGTQCEFLHRVPDATVDVFKIGSTTPAAMLLDAVGLYEKHDAKADDNIRGIREQLPEAVDKCLEAAAHEFNPQLQQRLLRAAAYGKCFLHLHPPSKMVRVLSLLRALNAVRRDAVGLPITYPQLHKLTPDLLVLRLARRQQHYLALQIAKYLRVRTEGVMVHWACERVLRGEQLTDQQLHDEIIKHLPPDTSFSDIATAAFNNNRPELAKLLLNNEPKAADQVPLLISMQEDKRALTKALESGDTDLTYLALLHIQRQRPVPDFFQTILRQPVARDLVINYSRHQDPQLLRQLYQALDQPQEVAALGVLDAYRYQDLPRRRKGLEQAAALFAQSKDENGKAMAKTTEDQLRLLEAQEELEKATGRAVFLDTSVGDTIKRCFALNQHKRGHKLAKDMKVADKLFWWLRVSGLAEGHEWGELEKLSKEKKLPPIGFEPFVEACIREGRNDEAVKYASKVTDMARRAELCVRMGMFRDAADAAVNARDRDLLYNIKAKAAAPGDIAYIDNLIAHSPNI